MNKTELVKRIAEKNGVTQLEAKRMLEATIDTMKEVLAQSESISLSGFGTFTVNERPAREGFNPITKEMIVIDAKKSIKFKASEELVNMLVN